MSKLFWLALAVVVIIIGSFVAYGSLAVPEVDGQYSEGNFPEEKFSQIKFGMSRQQVAELLDAWFWFDSNGNRVDPNPRQLSRQGCWRWSPGYQLPNRPYADLDVVTCFDKHNRVHRITHEVKFN